MANLSASDLAGRRIREARQRRSWTAKELAERCAEAGATHITSTVVTNLETRRRSTREISLDEVLVLAHVLGVPPLQLMIPIDAGEKLQVVPGTELDALHAVRWIAADTHEDLLKWIRSERPEDTERLLRWLTRASVTDLIRQLHRAAGHITQVDRWLADESFASVDRLAAKMVSKDPRGHTLPLLADRLMHIAARMEALGYDPPGLDDVREILRRRGLPSTLDEWRSQPAGLGVSPGPDGEGELDGEG